MLQTYHPCKESSSILQHWGSNVNQRARQGTETTSHSSLLFSPHHVCVSQTSSVLPLTKQRPLCSSGKDSKYLMRQRGRRVGISCVSSIWMQKPHNPGALFHSCWSSLAHVMWTSWPSGHRGHRVWSLSWMSHWVALGSSRKSWGRKPPSRSDLAFSLAV